MDFQNYNISIRGFEVNAVHLIIDTTLPTIVFLHDSLGCSELWRDFPQILAEQVRANVFMYDRRGYGKSDPTDTKARQKNYMELEAEILIELLLDKGLEHPALFGHSDGGTIALLAASKAPDMFSAIITEGAHVFVEDITLDGIAAVQQQYQTTDLKKRLEKYHGDNTDSLFHAWVETWQAPFFRDWNITNCLKRITCPVMVIQGSEDEFGTLDQVKAIAEGVKGNVETCVIPNAGHSPHKQAAIWLVNKCSSFLEQSFVPITSSTIQ